MSRSQSTDTRLAWKTLRAKFEALGGRARLTAEYYPEGSGPIGSGDGIAEFKGVWEVRSAGSDADRRDFLRLARLAAVAAGHPEHEESWVYWLHALRLADLTDVSLDHLNIDTVIPPVPPAIGPTFKSHAVVPVMRFEKLCQLSADYCESLASGLVSLPPLDTPAEKKRTRRDEREASATAKLIRAFKAVVETHGEILTLARDGAKVTANRRAGGPAAAREREVRKGRNGWRSRALAMDATLRSQDEHLSRKERAVSIAQKLGTVAFRTVYDALPKR